MSVSTKEIPDSVVESLLFANTPAYLFKRLRRDESVEALARAHSTSFLLDVVRSVAQAAEPSVPQLAFGYAALVALTFHENIRWHELSSDIASGKLRWAHELVTLNNLISRPTQRWVFKASPASIQQPPPQSASVSLLSHKADE